ncbi:hypothetical protein [Paenibacillus solani]|uniref:DUF4179 domain-containing protein n=1 Tax=Paenibacillus solani TaxID=1705565 RepID=A0A0M1N1D3_9BACL|nr:hypothetical protein [Paenibacillus solani]KOR75962.1 hypothetical protein AM231_25200 [Paenibacillus solani]
MNNKIKQAIEDIPIPAMLHERSLMGIHQAKEEWDAALAAPKRRKRMMNRVVAASLIGVLSIGAAATFNPHLSAAIQRALQFIPGIGVVQKADNSTDSYMLTEPIDIKNSNQSAATVTAVLVQKDLTMIEINDYSNNYGIQIKDESGKVHKASSSHTYGGDDFSHVILKFAGQVDVKDHVQLFFLDSPNEVFTIPLSKVDSIDTLNAIGQSSENHDLEITAIPTPAGHKGRIFLSTENSHPFRYYDSFPEKGDLIILNENISVTDELGNDYPIDNKGMRMPFKDIYFNLGSSDVKNYTLLIPQLISVGREEVKLSINIPDGEEGLLNQSFDIAGYPVELTKFKKLKSRFNEDYIAIYVEMPNPLQLSRSLKYFYVSTDTSIENGGAYDSTTGVMKFFEVKYDPNSTRLDVKVSKPMIDMKGPWKFEIAADKFKSQLVAERR